MKISVAKFLDKKKISNFIKKNWDKNHLLVKHKSYFNYLYKQGEHLNFLIYKDKKNNLIGILGFIKSSLTKPISIWTTMWMVKKNTNLMIGVEMLLKLIKSKKFSCVMSLGINKKTVEIYKYLKFKTGVLNHHFIPNNKIKIKKISKIPNNIKIKIFNFSNEKLLVKEIFINEIKDKFQFKKYVNIYPFKDFNYLKKKFFDHPINKYKFYGTFRNNELISFLILRIQEVKKSKCMRILDFYGKETHLKYLINYLINSTDFKYSEYIDFYNYGFNEKSLKDSGFLNKNDYGDKIIIPDFFNPFKKKNRDIYFFINKKNKCKFRFFKADGDQDRP